MKKLILGLILCLTLTGCNSDEDAIEQEKYANYSALYKTILDTSEFLESSDYFTTQLIVDPLDDGTYRYYVIIDEPQVAMYDVTALACIASELDITSDKMCPNVGIYEDKQYIMIPNQKNVAENYVSGLSLSAISENSELIVDVVVEWYDKTHTNNYRQLIQLNNQVEAAEASIEDTTEINDTGE